MIYRIHRLYITLIRWTYIDLYGIIRLLFLNISPGKGIFLFLNPQIWMVGRYVYPEEIPHNIRPKGAIDLQMCRRFLNISENDFMRKVAWKITISFVEKTDIYWTANMSSNNNSSKLNCVEILAIKIKLSSNHTTRFELLNIFLLEWYCISYNSELFAIIS